MESHDQQIKYIPVKDLVLWTENPRDPISAKQKNVNVIERALKDEDKKWRIKVLAKEMGERYDCSEIPTVVYEGGVPIVYDGNRRVVVVMLSLGIYSEFHDCKFKMPDCPDRLPCNVTTRKFALESVWRKHADTGSWDPISRDIFRHKFWKQEKSVFLQLNDILGGIIASSAHLNQRFVGEEVLTPSRLKDIGIKVENGQIISRHSTEDTRALLDDVFRLIKDKQLSTRANRTRPLSEIVSPVCKMMVIKDRVNDYSPLTITSGINSKGISTGDSPKVRLPRRIKSEAIPLFGGKLGLDSGEPANLYRDIVALYEYYEKYKGVLSDRFPALIRMALRLECELIAKCSDSEGIESLVTNGFDTAKSFLSQKEKTFLSNWAVTRQNMVSLLHTGAHNYEASYNLQQTIAMSLIVAGFLRCYCSAKQQGRQS